RVPCIIVSPWTAGGWVCSQPFDHTSILQFLERFTGVREPNISDWRRRTFGDLTSAFRFGEPAARPPVLPSTRGTLHQASYAAKHLPLPPMPDGEQPHPVQAPGARYRTPLANLAPDASVTPEGLPAATAFQSQPLSQIGTLCTYLGLQMPSNIDRLVLTVSALAVATAAQSQSEVDQVETVVPAADAAEENSIVVFPLRIYRPE